ncbi:MAG: hypothetical protein ABC527_04455, partial [Candidatus Methanosuratincola petrocarbonis]
LAAAHDFAIKDVYWATPSFPENRTLVVVLSYSGTSPAGSLNASLDVSQISADAQPRQLSLHTTAP